MFWRVLGHVNELGTVGKGSNTGSGRRDDKVIPSVLYLLETVSQRTKMNSLRRELARRLGNLLDHHGTQVT